MYALIPYTSNEWLVPCRRVYDGAGRVEDPADTMHAFYLQFVQGYV